MIVDIRIPPTHTTEGLEAARVIRQEFPATGIVVLSAHAEVEHAMELLASGRGIGYLLKSRVTDVTEFVQTLQRIAKGDDDHRRVLAVVTFLEARRPDPPDARHRGWRSTSESPRPTTPTSAETDHRAGRDQIGVVLLRVGKDQDHPSARQGGLPRQTPSNVKTTLPTKIDVEQRDVGPQLGGSLDGLSTSRRHAHDHPPGVPASHERQPGTEGCHQQSDSAASSQQDRTPLPARLCEQRRELLPLRLTAGSQDR